MKKILAFLLACIMAFSFAACNNDAAKQPVQETELPADMVSMAAPIDALARCMLENHMTYDPKDPEFFWTSLYYFVGAYGLEHDLVEETENYKLKVPRKVMQEHAIVLFSDYDLLELPAVMEGNIEYDNSWDAYLVSRGDIGLTEMKLTNAVPTETGYTLTAELWSVGETSEQIGVWEVTLVKNTYADGIENPLYLYSISSMQQISGDTPEAPAETATAVFNGFSDSHTVEVTLPDGTVQTFQIDADSETSEALQSLKEGDGVTFSYVTDTATGAVKIVSAE